MNTDARTASDIQSEIDATYRDLDTLRRQRDEIDIQLSKLESRLKQLRRERDERQPKLFG